MGIEKLRMAVSAAGFAMATSEDLLTATPIQKHEERGALRPADQHTITARPGGETVAVTAARRGGFRVWWHFLSGKDTT